MNDLREILNERVRDRDSKHLDPSRRAELIFNILFQSLGMKNPSDAISQPLFWDICCFSAEVINLLAMNMEDGMTTALARSLNNHIYSLHYSLPEGEPPLGPKKEIHEERLLKVLSKITGKGEDNGIRDLGDSLSHSGALVPPVYPSKIKESREVKE